jgi:hypothetical protein
MFVINLRAGPSPCDDQMNNGPWTQPIPDNVMMRKVHIVAFFSNNHQAKAKNEVTGKPIHNTLTN